jgi:hypothetical protein
MINKLKRLAIFGAAIGCGVLVAAEAEPWQVVTINEVTWTGSLKGGGEFQVHIETRKPKESREYFGTVDPPEAAVSEIAVKADGKISFPKPAFEDLANPLLQTLSVTSQPSGEIKVRFLGGAAGATYEVEYLIESGHLTKRTLKYYETKEGEKHEVIKEMTFK